MSEAAYNVNDLLIAEVGVKDYGDKENSELAERYQINKDDFPVVKLFVEGKNEPFTFTGEFKAENIQKFIRLNSGVSSAQVIVAWIKNKLLSILNCNFLRYILDFLGA